MPTMNISLPQELSEFVETERGTGLYGSASEVVRDARRLLRREARSREERLIVLRREIGRGIEDVRAGRLSPRSIGGIAAAEKAND